MAKTILTHRANHTRRGLSFDRDRDTQTALHKAAAKNQLGVVRLILTADASQAAVAGSYQRNALMLASMRGHGRIVGEILSLAPDAVDVNATDRNGKTALMLAVDADRAGCVEAMLDCPAARRKLFVRDR